jgi:hypothetical protein
VGQGNDRKRLSDYFLYNKNDRNARENKPFGVYFLKKFLPHPC